MKKKPTTNPDTFTASQVGVLIENLDSKIQAFAENQKAMDEKFTDQFQMLFEEMGRQKEKLFTLEVKISSMDERICKMDEKISVVATNVTEIKDTLKDHGKRIGRLEESWVK